MKTMSSSTTTRTTVRMMANHFHRSCSVASASLTSCGSLVENVVPAASFTDVVAAFTAISSRPAWS